MPSLDALMLHLPQPLFAIAPVSSALIILQSFSVGIVGIVSEVISSRTHPVTKPQSSKPVSVEMRGKKVWQEVREEGKNISPIIDQ